MMRASVDKSDLPTLEELKAMRFDTAQDLVAWVTANYNISPDHLTITPRRAVGLRYISGDIALSTPQSVYGLASDNNGGDTINDDQGGKWAFDELGLASLVKGTTEASKLDPFDLERARTLQKIRKIVPQAAA